MSKRKKFAIAEDINQGITEVIDAVKNNSGLFRYEIVALSRIEVDPENPRELALSVDDLSIGLSIDDVQFNRKQKEKEDLESLAITIKQDGIINPIMVYKYGDKYRIIAGERRFLAANLAGRNDIHARIVEHKPDEIRLRILQWIENNERKELSLCERLGNIEAIVKAYNKHHNKAITADALKDITGLSRTQSHCYLAILRGPDDVKHSVKNNALNNLDKAAFIAGISNDDLRKEVIGAAIRGESIKFLKEMSSNHDNIALQATKNNKKTIKMPKCVNLGKIQNIDPIKKIIEIVVSQDIYSKHANLFSKINWTDSKDAVIAFKKLLNILGN